MKYTVVLTSLLLIFLFGCNSSTTSDESNEKTFVSLYVRYLEAERDLKATATILQGSEIGNARSVKAAEPVFLNGQAMQERKLPEKIYRYTLQDNGLAYPQNFNYNFRLPNGQKNDIAVQMESVANFFVDSLCNKKEGLSLQLNSTFSAEESVVVLYTDANNKAHALEINGDQITEEPMLLSPAQIADWPSGKGNIYLVKKSRTVTTNEDTVIESNVEYYGETRELELVE